MGPAWEKYAHSYGIDTHAYRLATYRMDESWDVDGNCNYFDCATGWNVG